MSKRHDLWYVVVSKRHDLWSAVVSKRHDLRASARPQLGNENHNKLKQACTPHSPDLFDEILQSHRSTSQSNYTKISNKMFLTYLNRKRPIQILFTDSHMPHVLLTQFRLYSNIHPRSLNPTYFCNFLTPSNTHILSNLTVVMAFVNTFARCSSVRMCLTTISPRSTHSRIK